jgi:hypothetical protein
MKNSLIAAGMIICALSCNTGEDNTKLSDDRNETPTTIFFNITRMDGKENRPSLSIEYRKKQNQPGPRVVELYVKYSAEIELVSYATGTATADGKKELIVQKVEVGLLRIIIYSSNNTNQLNSGSLVSLVFNKISGGSARFEMLVDKPIFAPPEANNGLIIGDPITVRF